MTANPRAARPPGISLRAAGLSLALLTGLAAAQTAPATPPSPPASASPAAPAAAPFTLGDALNLLPNSPQWRQADLAYQAAQQALRSAQAGAGLSLAAGGSASVVGGSLSASVDASASLNVLPWSSTNDAIRSAERALVTARTTLATTRAKLRLTVTQQYFAARLAEQDLAVAQQTSALRQALLAAATAQRVQNTATQETLLTRQADAQQAAASLASAQSSLQTGTFALAGTLGVTLTGVTFSSAASLPDDPGDLNALVARALAQRAEVVGATESLASAQADLDAARRSRSLPALSATLKYGGSGSGAGGTSLSTGLDLQSGDLTASFSQPLTGSQNGGSLSLGVSASYAILDPAADAKIASAQLSVSSAQTGLALARQTVEQDVRQQVAQLAAARGALEAARTRVQAAQTALDTTRAQLAAGLAVATDVTSAQLNLLSANRDLENALETAQIAAASLQTATGGTP